MKNTWIWVAVIVVVIIGGWALFTNKKTAVAPTTENSSQQTPPVGQTPSQTNSTIPKKTTTVRQTNIVAPVVTPAPSGQTLSVTYTGGSFSPNPIRIKQGYTVVFVNKGDYQMWVASDPHPSHTNYPGFDERTSVGKDGTNSFTFQRIGTWGYHNHLNYTQTGTVIVEPN